MASIAELEIPFSCVICINEFDSKEHVPMVLPCGHTYICEPCTKRLDCCIECRKPLFMKAPAKSPLQSPVSPRPRPSTGMVMRSTISARRPSNSISAPVVPQPAKEEKIPLPISKNLVLISLIEASKKEEQHLDPKVREDTEIELILDAIEDPASTCGTYIVKEDSLVVIESDPRRTGSSNSDPLQKEICRVKKGHSVQIVDVSDDIYKLARGGGFIVASDKQIEKVSGPFDNSCRLEGMKNIIRNRKEDLKQRLAQLKQISIGVTEHIESLEDQKPSYPIISADPENSFTEQEKENEEINQGSDEVSGSISSTSQEAKKEKTGVQSPDVTKVTTPDKKIEPASPNSVNSDLIFPELDLEASASCTSFSWNCATPRTPDRNARQIYQNNTFDESLLLGTQSPGDNSISSPNRINYSECIDYSTGLSGHGALTGKKKLIRFTSGTREGRNQVRRNIRMMGEHRGLSFQSPGKITRNKST